MAKKKKRRLTPREVESKIAEDVEEGTLDLIDEAIDKGQLDPDRMSTLLMHITLRLARCAAVETILDKKLKQKAQEDPDFEDELDDLTEQVNRIPTEKLWKLFLELMGKALSTRTGGRYRVVVMEANTKLKPKTGPMQAKGHPEATPQPPNPAQGEPLPDPPEDATDEEKDKEPGEEE